jgi:nicotinate-nucleotide adenylyltransferase|tara:strand:+ start:451 stop:1056 length:606 start_codon:yes stop_codon:yes gene_type:complete
VSLGFFGGSFDPPHFGHIAMAKEAIDFLGIDVLNVCPVGSPFGKKNINSQDYLKRFHMADVAFSGINKLKVVDWEKKDDASYTIKTVQSLRQRVGDSVEVYLIMGLDSFLSISSWKQYECLLSTTKVVVFLRGENGREKFNQMVNKLTDLSIITDNIICMNSKIPDIASSDIRKKILEGGSVNTMLPEEVERLYRSYLEVN